MYFRIRTLLNTKLMGHYPVIKRYIHHTHIYNPAFVGRIFFEKVDYPPITLDIELYPNAKIMDLIECGGQISSFLPVSTKLKTILQRSRQHGMQFFPFKILHRGIYYDNYWLLNMYEFNQEYINFRECVVRYEKHAEDFETTYETKIVYPVIHSIESFESYIELAREKAEVISIEKLSLCEEKIHDNFFALRYTDSGVGYYVSEKLKKEIESAGCTGIEFQPIELSYAEWTAPGGEREKVYGKM